MTPRKRVQPTVAEEAPITTPEHEISTETAVMTDAEVVETLVRTDEEHLDDFDEDGNRLTPAEVPLPVQVLPGTTPGTESALTQGTYPQMFHVLSQIDDGVFVAWDFCRRCGQRVSSCTDKDGPQEPKYVTTWREEYLATAEKAVDKRVKDLMNKVAERAAADQTPVPTTVEPEAATEATEEDK